MAQTARSLPTSPILNGTDALADLTRNLDDQLRMDALKQQRGPSPFQVQLHMLFALVQYYAVGESVVQIAPIQNRTAQVFHMRTIAKAARGPF